MINLEREQLVLKRKLNLVAGDSVVLTREQANRLDDAINEVLNWLRKDGKIEHPHTRLTMGK